MNTEIDKVLYDLPISWHDFHKLVINSIIYLQNMFRHSKNNYYNMRINPSVYHVVKYLIEYGLDEKILCNCIGVSIKYLIDNKQIALTNWYINDYMKYKVAISRN
jgi:hypothetical protein